MLCKRWNFQSMIDICVEEYKLNDVDNLFIDSLICLGEIWTGITEERGINLPKDGQRELIKIIDKMSKYVWLKEMDNSKSIFTEMVPKFYRMNAICQGELCHDDFRFYLDSPYSPDGHHILISGFLIGNNNDDDKMIVITEDQHGLPYFIFEDSAWYATNLLQNNRIFIPQKLVNEILKEFNGRLIGDNASNFPVEISVLILKYGLLTSSLNYEPVHINPYD